MAGDTVATATAGEMPMKISSGVIRKPPPMPNMPEMKPTASPMPEDQEHVHRQVGDRKIDLQGCVRGLTGAPAVHACAGAASKQ